MRKVIVASLIGTSLEWYDFFIYGTAAALVFNKLFFPSFDPLVGTLLAFATYAVGFVARPLGGVVFGHYGDKLGRKNVLVVTLLLMGIATFADRPAADATTTHRRLGAHPAGRRCASCRASASAASGAARCLMTLESGDAQRRGLNASWPQVGVPIGLLLANGVLSLMGALTSNDGVLDRWGWRVPFLLSGLLVVVGLVDPAVPSRRARCSGRSRPAHSQGRCADRRSAAPLPASRCCWPSARGSGSTSPSTPSCCSSRPTSPPTSSCRASYALNAVLIAAAVQVLLIPFFGACPTGSRAGRSTWPVRSAQRIWVFVFFALLDTGQFGLIVLAAVVALIFHAAMYGPQAAFIAEMFPTKVRYTGASMGYQLAGILGGALAPIISVALLDRYDTSLAVSIYVVVMLAVTMVCVLLAPETSQIDSARRIGHRRAR